MNKDSNKRKRLRQASLGVLSAAAVFASLGFVNTQTVHASESQMHVSKALNLSKSYNGVSADKLVRDTIDKKMTGYWFKADIKGQPFGVSKGAWSQNPSNSRYLRYIKKPSEAGRVGMLYPNALNYHYYDKAKKTWRTKKLTVRITWMGGPANWDNHKIIFNKRNFSMWMDGYGRDQFKFTYYSDEKGTKEESVAVPFTFKDIDGPARNQGGQTIELKGKGNEKTFHYSLYDNGTKLHAINDHTFGGDWGFPLKKDGKREGTVLNNDPDGAITFLTKKTASYNFIFGHEDMSPYKNFQTGKFNPGKTWDNKTIQHAKTLITSKNTDYFAMDSNQHLASYSIEAKKFVSNKPKGKFTKTSMTIDSTKPVYFDIRSHLKWPTMRFVKSNNTDDDYNAYPNKSGAMTVTDKLDKSMAVDGVTIYYSTTANGKLHKAPSSWFNKYTVSKNNKVTVKMNKDVAKVGYKDKKDGRIWNKYFHVVIKTHVKKGTKPTYNKDGYGYRKIKNI